MPTQGRQETMTGLWAWWVPGVWTLLHLGACHPAATPTPQAEATTPPGEVSNYAPLEDGTVLAYETSAEGVAEHGLVVWQIRRPRPDLVELDNGGRTQRLYIAPDAIRHAVGGYWLKAPLNEGACWPGRDGTTCIISVSVEVTVPAGHFEGCLQTEERKGTEAMGTRTTTVFCPGVGMVLLEVEGWSEGTLGLERAELTYHGPRVDLDVPNTP